MCNLHIVLTLRLPLLPYQGYLALCLFPVVHLARSLEVCLEIINMFKNWKGCRYQGKIHLGTQLQYSLVLTDIMLKYLVYQYTHTIIQQNIGLLLLRETN